MRMDHVYVFVLFLCLSVMQGGCSSPSSNEAGNASHRPREIGKSPGRITIDGKSGDWSEIRLVTQDVGSKERENASPRIDLKTVKLTHDGESLYFLLEAQPVSSGTVSIYVDSDGNKSTGVTSVLIGSKTKMPQLCGWDYIIKLTYSSYAVAGKTQPLLIYQVEKLEKTKYGHKSVLVGTHLNSRENHSYAGIEGKFQEIRIPFKTLGINLPTGIAFLFVEGSGGMFTEYDKHCRLVKVTLK